MYIVSLAWQCASPQLMCFTSQCHAYRSLLHICTSLFHVYWSLVQVSWYMTMCIASTDVLHFAMSCIRQTYRSLLQIYTSLLSVSFSCLLVSCIGLFICIYKFIHDIAIATYMYARVCHTHACVTMACRHSWWHYNHSKHCNILQQIATHLGASNGATHCNKL